MYLQVILNNTAVTYYSEPSWDQCAQFQQEFRSYAATWMPVQDLFSVGNDTLHIGGSYIRPVPIKDLLINETGEANRHPIRVAPATKAFFRLHKLPAG